jgi:uncharacterized membrane protein YhaH (DUF805 family)
MKYFIAALKKYADFSGRSRRSEYWYFVLFYIIFYCVLAVLGLYIGFPFLALILLVGMLVPSLAVGVRRMHDVDRSGWYMFIPIYSLILACTDGTPGPNRFGSDPKQPDMVDDIDRIGQAND